MWGEAKPASLKSLLCTNPQTHWFTYSKSKLHSYFWSYFLTPSYRYWNRVSERLSTLPKLLDQVHSCPKLLVLFPCISLAEKCSPSLAEVRTSRESPHFSICWSQQKLKGRACFHTTARHRQTGQHACAPTGLALQGNTDCAVGRHAISTIWPAYYLFTF